VTLSLLDPEIILFVGALHMLLTDFSEDPQVPLFCGA